MMPPKNKNSHLGGKSPMDRVKEFPGEFYVEKDQKLLFCATCEKTVDHARKSSVVEHVNSKKHLEKKERKEKKAAELDTTGEPAAKMPRQSSIVNSITNAWAAKEARDTVTSDFLHALVSANIPIEKADNPQVKQFLEKHVRNGGSIAGSAGLRKKIPQLYEAQEEHLKKMFAGRDVCVITDETTDDRGKMVLHILLCSSVTSSNDVLRPYLIDSVQLEKVNAGTVGGAVLRSLTQFGVSFDSVSGFVCDGARYMTACYRDIIKPVCENSVHITCIAHCLNLVGEILRKKSPDVDKFVVNMKTAFRLSSRKKRAYMEFLLKAGVQKPTYPPVPIVTRWYSWLLAVAHHSKYFTYYPSMMKEIQEYFGDAAGVEELEEVLTNASQYKALKWKLNCISTYGQKIIHYLKLAEGQSPVTHKAYNNFRDLHSTLSAASHENWMQHLRSEGFNLAEATNLQRTMKTCLSETASRVEKFISSNDSGWLFLKAIRAFDPNQLLALPSDLKNYVDIPGLVHSPLLAAEWLIYRNVVVELQGEACDNILTFWNRMHDRTPQLAVIASRYLCIPVNSVDAERSFSVYNNVVSNKRHNLTDTSTKHLVGLYYNSAALNKHEIDSIDLD